MGLPLAHEPSLRTLKGSYNDVDRIIKLLYIKNLHNIYIKEETT
jgi:hypothetical protein